MHPDPGCACAIEQDRIENHAPDGETAITEAAKCMRAREFAVQPRAVRRANAHAREFGCTGLLDCLERAHVGKYPGGFRAQVLCAGFVAGKPRSIYQQDGRSGSRQAPRCGRTRGTATDHDHVLLLWTRCHATARAMR
jgi:hypothetical protein